MIYFVSPWAYDGDLGDCYNDYVERFREDSWICIQDGDTIWLPDDWGDRVGAVVEVADSEGYEFVGVMTNRIGNERQLHNGNFSNRHGMKEHAGIAERRWRDHGPEIVPHPERIGGPVFLFPRTAWERVGGFVKGPATRWHDSDLSERIKKTGGRAGLALGLYAYHAYRLDHKDRKQAKADYSHLRASGGVRRRRAGSRSSRRP